MARRVPPPTADYYFGAADREITMGDNEGPCARRVLSRAWASTSTRSPCTVLGQEISLPVIAAPVGSLRNLWPRGEAVAAAAVGKAGSICTLSTLTGTRLEEVKEGGQRPVLVPIVSGWRERRSAQEHRARATERLCGARADHRHAGRRRLRDKRNGAETLINGTWTRKLPYTLMMLRHERWFNFAPTGA